MELPNEAPYRLAFVTFWVVNFVVRAYFQARSRGSQRAFTRNHRSAVLGFRILAVAYVLLLLYPLTTWFDFAHFGLPPWIRWTFGPAFLGLYLILFASAHLALGRHWSGVVEIYQDHALVTGGPYRLVRHPMYAAFFLSCIGIVVLTCNWMLSGIYTAAAAFMYLSRVASEEEMMTEKFGDAYREYTKGTGRLLPLLRKGRRVR